MPKRARTLIRSQASWPRRIHNWSRSKVFSEIQIYLRALCFQFQVHPLTPFHLRWKRPPRAFPHLRVLLDFQLWLRESPLYLPFPPTIIYLCLRLLLYFKLCTRTPQPYLCLRRVLLIIHPRLRPPLHFARLSSLHLPLVFLVSLFSTYRFMWSCPIS